MQLIETLKNSLAANGNIYITVRAVPKSPATELVGLMADGSYKIRVAAPPEGGKANAALVRFLKKELNASEAVIVSGQTDRIKLLRIKI